MKLNGVVKIFANGVEVDCGHNTWSSEGLVRLTAMFYKEYIQFPYSCTINKIMLKFSDATTQDMTLSSKTVTSTTIVSLSGSVSVVSGKTLSSLFIVGSDNMNSSTFASYTVSGGGLPFPEAMTLSVFWDTTLSSTLLTASALNTIGLNLLDANSPSATIGVSSFGIVHSGGTYYVACAPLTTAGNNPFTLVATIPTGTILNTISQIQLVSAGGSNWGSYTLSSPINKANDTALITKFSGTVANA